jgi:hypothetical protein
MRGFSSRYYHESNLTHEENRRYDAFIENMILNKRGEKQILRRY